MDSTPDPPDTDGGEAGPAPSGDYVTISRAELDALRARAESAVRPDDTEEPAPRRTDAVTRGREAQAARESAERDRRVAELEQTCKAAVRERELATALAGRPLVAGAAAQLIKLWREDFDVYEEGGAYKVSSHDGRPVGQVIGDRLASSEYSHFCLPTSRGGTGARDANRPSSGSAPAAAPKNLGESIVMKWRDESAARPNNLLKPIGLRRHR
ncbi:MAG: hypothetical protein LC745_08385 [Planctomycetia bacterium]|nr:hypothetical protein [Planctomycetia bacterium]